MNEGMEIQEGPTEMKMKLKHLNSEKIRRIQE